MYCKQCGSKIKEGCVFCSQCGMEVDKIPLKKKHKSKKWLYIPIIAVIFLIIAAGVLILKGKTSFSSDKEYEYAAKFEKISMDEEQQAEYQLLMEELRDGITKGSTRKIEVSCDKLDILFLEYEQNNIELIEASNRELDSYISTGLFDVETQLIEQYRNNADTYQNEKNYRGALEEYRKCKALYENAENSQEFQFRVEQIDALSFPNIKLYVSAYEKQTDICVSIDRTHLTIKELASDIYQDVEIRKVSKLNEKERLNTCLVADVSGSMYNQMNMVKDVMTRFVNCMQYDVGDQGALITFNNYIKVVNDFTDNEQELTNKIQDLCVGNSTALYDALYVAVCKAAEAEGAKCVIAFTDGYDNVSTKTESDVISIASTYGIPVYLIGIGDSVDTNVLQRLSEATGGYYQNVHDSSTMQEIYNSIYQRNKELYLIEYTTQVSEKDTMQNLYLAYNDGDTYMRCESNFLPSQLLEKEEEYKTIIQKSGIDASDIENEVDRIREVYNDIVASRDSKSYVEENPANGVTTYKENGNVRCAIFRGGTNNSPYTRYYYYEGGKLIFAYLESNDSHRLYFKDDQMFRWRYASDAVAFSEADNHDKEDSAEFRKWETFALGEAYLYK